MNEIESKTCPLCASQAQAYDVDHGDKDYFKCDHCGSFIISGEAARRLEETPMKYRQPISAAALTAPPDHVLLIVKGTYEQQDAGEPVVWSVHPKNEFNLSHG